MQMPQSGRPNRGTERKGTFQINKIQPDPPPGGPSQRLDVPRRRRRWRRRREWRAPVKNNRTLKFHRYPAFKKLKLHPTSMSLIISGGYLNGFVKFLCGSECTRLGMLEKIEMWKDTSGMGVTIL